MPLDEIARVFVGMTGKRGARVASAVLLCAALSACGDEDTQTMQEADAGAVAQDAGETNPYEGIALDEFVAVDPGEGMTYESGDFEVDPGQEGTHCMRVPMPERFRDQDMVLVGMDADLPPSTHHFFMSYSEEPFPGDGDQAVPCVGDDGYLPIEKVANEGAIGGGKIVMGAGVGLHGYRTPPMTGRLLRKGGHFITNHHVLNISEESARLYSRINLLLEPASEVDYPSNALNCLSTDVDLEPGEARVVTATCTTPIEVDLVLLGSHMHQHGVKFETRIYDGEKGAPRDEIVYSSYDWDSPRIDGTRPVRLRKGDGITFSCFYENTSSAKVTYGLGVDSEMCAFMGGFSFPQDQAPKGLPPSLGTLIPDNAVASPLIDTTKLNILPF